MYRANHEELDFEDELAGSVSLLEGPLGKKLKKKLKKGFALAATGGLAGAAMLAKKKKRQKAAGKVKALAAKAGKAIGLQVAIRPKNAKTPTPSNSTPISPKAAKTLARVGSKRAGDCGCMDDMAQLVAAQLVAKLGPPLSEANKRLRMQEIQRQATYEHKKLMTDENFRKRVLALLTLKAANGNQSCERTVRVLMGR